VLGGARKHLQEAAQMDSAEEASRKQAPDRYGAWGKWTEEGQIGNRLWGGWARREGRGRGVPVGGRRGRWMWDVGELADDSQPHARRLKPHKQKADGGARAPAGRGG
jgi:hypothetical protein